MKRSAVMLAITLVFLLGFRQAAWAQDSTDPPSDGSRRTEQQPKAKEGSKDDINAIGNRDIGGRGLGNWYSLETEIRMGKEYAQMIDSTVKLVKDPAITEYVNRVGQNIVRNSDAKVPFTIKVVDANEVNAFALPGGFFYVNSGLLLVADEESELAGVMAHEVAHVAARHAMRQMTRANLANIASIPLIFVGGGVGYAVRSAAGLGLPMTFMKFSRGFEEEADYLACSTCTRRAMIRNRSWVFSRSFRLKRRSSPAVFRRFSPVTQRSRVGLRRPRSSWKPSCHHAINMLGPDRSLTM